MYKILISLRDNDVFVSTAYYPADRWSRVVDFGITESVISKKQGIYLSTYAAKMMYRNALYTATYAKTPSPTGMLKRTVNGVYAGPAREEINLSDHYSPMAWRQLHLKRTPARSSVNLGNK